MNQIKAGTALNYAVLGLNVMLGLVYTPYMLRCLGQNEYGLYALVMSIAGYMSVLDFGLANSVVRFTAHLRAKGQHEAQASMLGMVMLLYGILGILVLCAGSAVCMCFNDVFSGNLTNGELFQARSMLLLVTLNIALSLPLSVFDGVAAAYEQFVFQKTVQLLRIALCASAMVGLLYWGYKAVAIVTVQTGFNILALVLNGVFCIGKLKVRIHFRRFNVQDLKEIGGYSFWIFLNTLIDRLYWGTGQLILGAVSGTRLVAVFSVAVTLQSMYTQFSTSLTGVMLPRVTAMVASGGSHREISDLFVRVGRWQAMTVFLVLSGFAVFGKTFVSLWAGSGYDEVYTLALLFMVPLAIPLTQNLGLMVLQARNCMRFRSLCVGAVGLFALVLQVVLAPRFGALGCGVAIAVGLLCGQGIVMNWYYKCRQYLDIRAFWRSTARVGRVGVVLGMSGLISGKLVDYSDSMNLMIGIAVYLLAYVLLMARFGLYPSERKAMKEWWVSFAAKCFPRFVGE